MGKLKVLIVDLMHSSLVSMLNKIGIEAHYEPTITRNEILDKIATYEGLIIRSKTILNKEFFEKAKSLNFIARAGAGLDLIEVAIAQERNIILLNAPEGNRDAVAEYTLGALLSLLRNLVTGNSEVRMKIWDREKNRGSELMGKTVGILGYGYMGQAFAARLASLHCKVLAYDINYRSNSSQHVHLVDIGTFLSEVEILSIHIPLDIRNLKLINKKYLEQFKKLEIVINTSRGEVLSMADLLSLLKNGIIKGAILDVLENEKLNSLTTEQEITFAEFIKQDKVLLTPHIAGWTFESYKKINEVLIEKIVEAGLVEYSG